MQANKSGIERWPSQGRFYLSPLLRVGQQAKEKVIKAAKAFQACGRTRRQIHLSGHICPNLV